MTTIVDYDSNGYDYRTYWTGRDYEAWAEDRALHAAIPLLNEPGWLADFGAGFGRNAAHYRNRAGRYVLVDYSATNLHAAAESLAGDIADGRAFLVRADLNRLPFIDGAFDAAMIVRVLHHLPEMEAALAEMGRTVRHRWLLDVPIKHHALGLARAAVHGNLAVARGPAPVSTGTSDTPFWNFQLDAVRGRLQAAGWHTRVIASVNNLRRWDRSLPAPIVRTLTPAARAVETAARYCGRGWWGPSQFVYAERTTPLPAPDMPGFAARLICPACRGGLSWTHTTATCRRCFAEYERRGGYWDFTLA